MSAMIFVSATLFKGTRGQNWIQNYIMKNRHFFCASDFLKNVITSSKKDDLINDKGYMNNPKQNK
jgi:hypothetical protein